MEAPAPGTPVPKAPAYRLEKLKEDSACLRCGWEIFADQPVVLDGDLVFCSRRCQQAAVSDPHQFELGGES